MTPSTPSSNPPKRRGGPRGTSSGYPEPTREVKALLERTSSFLNQGEPQKALDAIAHAKLSSPWITNAVGVCRLRLGHSEIAMNLFRGLVIAPGEIHLRSDVPNVFKLNFAIALLHQNNVGGSQSALAELPNDHPTVDKIQQTIRDWKRGLSFWQKLNWYAGGQPNHPIHLGFLPGDLE